MTTWRRVQPPLAFLAGSLILFHEVVIYEGGDRLYVLLTAVTLMGFGSLLKADSLLKNLGVNVTISRRGEENRPSTAPKEGAGP